VWQRMCLIHYGKQLSEVQFLGTSGRYVRPSRRMVHTYIWQGMCSGSHAAIAEEGLIHPQAGHNLGSL